ncbi:MAG TPA: phytanoyl-CoA dioxygenase family protein [Tepidisphaeraceae bacterium]|jgi:ectoine hydroxylase-related dioxygenase (phytanoyl-CoA dioxygenase family)
MLTAAQVQQFQNDGFLLGSRVIDDQQVEVLRNELTRVIDTEPVGENGPFRIVNLHSDQKTPVWQILNIWLKSEPFKQLLFNQVITEEIAQLTGGREVRLWHDQIQYKPAGIGGVNMWHQDHPYWANIKPAVQVSAWVALDDVDASNGCMSMVPGSHLWGNQISFLHTLKSFDAMPKEHAGHAIEVRLAPVRKGHVHYHHALTWHGSHANTSGRPRRAIALHYMPEQTLHVAAGAHPLKSFITVPDGAPMAGEYFPLVWPRK